MTTPTDRPTAPATVEDLLDSTQRQLEDPFTLMGLAEEEIEQAIAEHPEAADLLFHSFALLRPTSDSMRTEFVYRGHVREILARVVTGQDTRPGTAAEACLALCDISLKAPLNTAAAGLYTRMWQLAFADVHPMPNGQHYEALVGAEMDEFEAATRSTTRQAWRRLNEIDCAGRHHGAVVACRFAAPQAAKAS
jgi:hypothetical protein